MKNVALRPLACVALTLTAACSAPPERGEDVGATSDAWTRVVTGPTPGMLGWDMMSTEQRVEHLKSLVDKLTTRVTAAEQRVETLERELDEEVMKNDRREVAYWRAIGQAGGKNSPACTGHVFLTLSQMGVKIPGMNTDKLVVSTGSCP